MQTPTPSHHRALMAALPLSVLAVWGCSLVESAQSDKVLAATVLATPSCDLKFLLPDASLPFDSGIPLNLPDAGYTVVPSQTAAQIFFGKRNEDLTAQPTGIAGATVTLSIGGTSFTLPDQGSGTYGLTTLQDPSFLYQDGARVEVSVVSEGVTYTANVTAPGKETIAQFEALGGWPLLHDANAPLELTRSSTDEVAFTTVIAADQNTDFSNLAALPSTYTDFPTTPLDLLDLVANDSLWKRKVIPLPGTAFPTAGRYYAVTITSVKRGDTSNNLFTASAFLVGKADLGVVRTR